MKEKRPHPSAIIVIHKGLAATASLPGFAVEGDEAGSR
jgi:hypothetical protein